MSFERQLRVAGLWTWLPSFRAAAEYESVQRAALAFKVSPSSISRNIKQLEKAVGSKLFERLTTGVRLTAAGHRLLAATRLGMRRVDDALEPLTPGYLRVGAVPPFLPALVAGQLPPEANASLVSLRRDDVVGALQRGDVDAVVTTEPEVDEGLDCRPWAQVPTVIARPKGAGTRIVSSDAGPDRADDLHAMLVLAERRRCGVVVPAPLAPVGWRVEAQGAPLQTFFVVRRSSIPLSPELEALLPLPAAAGRGQG